MRVKLDKVCKRIYAGGDVPKDRYSTVKTAEYAIPIYANAEKGNGLYGYTDTARENELSITVAARGTIGFTAIRREPFLPVVRLITVVPDLSTVSERYLYYALRNCKPASSGTSIPQLTVPDIKKNEIELYSLSVQETIADKLDAVGRVIELRQQQLQTLDELVKARFVELFGDPETNPNGWEQVTVGDVCSSIVRGPFGSALKKDFFVEPSNSTYKVYEQKHAIQKSATIGTYYITEEKYQELKRFECLSGDIIMSCSGTMGELYQLPERCERGIINQALCKFTLNNKMLPICFLTYMRQTIGNLETKGSGIKNIAAVSYVKAMPINLPPMSVQIEFESFCKQTDKSKVAVQKALDASQLLFDSLMQKYFG